MSDVDVIEEVMRQVGYPGYPNLSFEEKKIREKLFEESKRKNIDKDFEPIEF